MNVGLVTQSVQQDARDMGTDDAKYDVFIDLRTCGSHHVALDAYLNCLAGDADPAGHVGLITIALPSDEQRPATPAGLHLDTDPGTPVTEMLSQAIARAGARRRHLAVLLGPVFPGHQVLSLLVEAFNHDPMFGSAQPRFVDNETDRIWPLPCGSDHVSPSSSSSRAALQFLPACIITPELLAACIVLRWAVLVATDAAECAYAGAPGLLLDLLTQARRRGMRNVVLNEAVVPSDLTYRTLYPQVPNADLTHLRATYPDNALAERELADLTLRRLEPLLGAAHPVAGHRRILLDCRGMPPRRNGSSQWVRGVLSGFAALAYAEEIDVLVSPEAAKAHGLAERYPHLRQVYGSPDGEYGAAVYLTQPWDLKTVADLHRHALVVAFAVLDTIAWDILYASGASGLGTIWRFIARHADGLLYISDFTRARFSTRFPLAAGVAERVTRPSLSRDEHVDPTALAAPLSDHILVFGNDYDHKNLLPTVQLLVDAFPFNRIVAFGASEASAPSVTAIPSGELEGAQLHQLIANARVIVYPSFYEGFGLPVVEGMAYGRPVVVRRSPLWAEIASWSRLPGELVEFDDAPSLVEAVGRLLAGLPGRPLPRGVALNGAAPAGWKECAAGVITLLDDCISTADGGHWREREEALLLAGL